MPEYGLGDHGPRGGVGVLPAVLSNAGRVALDITRIMRGAVEGRCEQQHETGVGLHEAACHARQGELCATAIAGSANDAP